MDVELCTSNVTRSKGISNGQFHGVQSWSFIGMPRHRIVHNRRCISKVPRVFKQSIPIRRFLFKRHVLSFESLVTITCTTRIEVQHSAWNCDIDTIFIKCPRPLVGQSILWKHIGIHEQFPINPSIENLQLNDWKRVGNDNNDDLWRTLCSVFIGHHELNDLLAWLQEGIRRQRLVAECTIWERPIEC